MKITYVKPRHCLSLASWFFWAWCDFRYEGVRILGLEIEWRR